MPLFKCENCGKTTNTALTACYWGSEKKLCYECCLEARKEVEKALCNKELTTKAVKLAIKDQNKKMKKPPKCLDFAQIIK